jgi:hypothetical protein
MDRIVYGIDAALSQTWPDQPYLEVLFSVLPLRRNEVLGDFSQKI